ncbi:hypothetical protein AX16_002704 [Volvariella volvacea WC 439]|nr:hypothetical protein AX16_002704 [Volvariella volvacea WC 439]
MIMTTVNVTCLTHPHLSRSHLLSFLQCPYSYTAPHSLFSLLQHIPASCLLYFHPASHPPSPLNFTCYMRLMPIRDKEQCLISVWISGVGLS